MADIRTLTYAAVATLEKYLYLQLVNYGTLYQSILGEVRT